QAPFLDEHPSGPVSDLIEIVFRQLDIKLPKRPTFEGTLDHEDRSHEHEWRSSSRSECCCCEVRMLILEVLPVHGSHPEYGVILRPHDQILSQRSVIELSPAGNAGRSSAVSKPHPELRPQ